MHNVFVYGTLKAGFRNHSFLTGARRVIQTPVVLGGFKMYSIGGYYPAAVRGEGEITGEVYGVRTLAGLDRLEGNGFLYKREREPIIIPEVGMIEAWIYLFNLSVVGFEEVPSGCWVPGIARTLDITLQSR